MSLSSDFQASGPLPSATYAGWDAQTNQKAIWEVAGAGGGGGGGDAVGPANAVQYSDGAGAFQGSANCVVDAAGNLYADNSVESGGTLISGGGLTVGAGANVTGEIIGGANVTQTDTNATASLSIVKARTLSLLLPPAGAGVSLSNPVRCQPYYLYPPTSTTGVPNTPITGSTIISAPTLMPSQGGFFVAAAGFDPSYTNGVGQVVVVYNPDWNPDTDMLLVTPLTASLGQGIPNPARIPVCCSVIKDPNGQAGGFQITYWSNNFVSGNGYTGAPYTSINGVVPSGTQGTWYWPFWAWDGPNSVNGTPPTNAPMPVFFCRILKGHA